MTPPLLSTVFFFVLVGRAIRCGSIPHTRPRGRRRFVRFSFWAGEIVVLLLLRSSLII
jgi:hypothetical protein